ncbi:hypothetical protein Bbelb_166150 [Branchiostoma belcheri]|nr:hypothetical protein Bbelb_166150 [Branchiostoma belcheri]
MFPLPCCLLGNAQRKLPKIAEAVVGSSRETKSNIGKWRVPIFGYRRLSSPCRNRSTLTSNSLIWDHYSLLENAGRPCTELDWEKKRKRLSVYPDLTTRIWSGRSREVPTLTEDPACFAAERSTYKVQKIGSQGEVIKEWVYWPSPLHVLGTACYSEWLSIYHCSSPLGQRLESKWIGLGSRLERKQAGQRHREDQAAGSRGALEAGRLPQADRMCVRAGVGRHTGSPGWPGISCTEPTNLHGSDLALVRVEQERLYLRSVRTCVCAAVVVLYVPVNSKTCWVSDLDLLSEKAADKGATTLLGPCFAVDGLWQDQQHFVVVPCRHCSSEPSYALPMEPGQERVQASHKVAMSRRAGCDTNPLLCERRLPIRLIYSENHLVLIWHHRPFSNSSVRADM